MAKKTKFGQKLPQKTDLPKFYFLYLNFWTRNLRKPIKALNDTDFNFVSTKNLSKYFPLVVGPGPGNLSQNGQKPTLLMTSPTKNLKPKTKIFFIAN